MELSTFTALMLIAISMIFVMRHFLGLGRYTDELLVVEVCILALILTGAIMVDLLAFHGQVLVTPFIGVFTGGETEDSLIGLVEMIGPENLIYFVFTALLLVLPMVGALFYLARRQIPV